MEIGVTEDRQDRPAITFGRRLLLRTFGCPEGLLGRLGGLVMARMNRNSAAWAIDLLDVQDADKVLEIGFGPGIAIQMLASRASAGLVAGVDSSEVMVQQASARNTETVTRGRVELRHGSVQNLPFADCTFDKALAVNSMQVWPDAAGGLRELHRVMRNGGTLALAFTSYSGQPKEGLDSLLNAAGFAHPHLVHADGNFCALAVKP